MASLRDLRVGKVAFVETEDANVRLQKLMTLLQEIAIEAVNKNTTNTQRKDVSCAK